MITVAIIEDQEEVMNLMIEILNMSKNIKLAGAFFDGKSAIRNVPLLQPDIVIVDLGLPDLSGVECISALKPICTNIEFMVWSVFGDETHVYDALEAGASSYLLKTATPQFILQSIEELRKGGSPMSPEIARTLIRRLFQPQIRKNNPVSELVTAREFEILELLAKGFLYKEIAEQLHISINTLKVHCYNIYQKLHVSNKIEAINMVMDSTRKN